MNLIKVGGLEAMPLNWQHRFVEMLEEMSSVIDTEKLPESFHVRVRKNGRFVHDPYADYRRGKAPLKETR